MKVTVDQCKKHQWIMRIGRLRGGNFTENSLFNPSSSNLGSVQERMQVS